MFTPIGLGAQIFKDRYAFTPEETRTEASRRVAKHVALAEEPAVVARWEDAFYNILDKDLFNPGGRIWRGAGLPASQMLNCFVVPTGDSREAWGKTTSDVIVISGLMGGVGLNHSPIRGRGFPVKGTHGYATGAVSFMKLIDGVGDVIVGGGGRRMALMQCLDINHPDILEFLEAKRNLNTLNNSNISAVFPSTLPPEVFRNLVLENGSYPLVFNGKEYGKLNARTVWDTIVENSLQSAEPGILNGHLANKMNNIWYYKPLISTNPCGEIWLEEYGCCDLGALVLPRFVNAGVFDFDLFDSTIRTAVRFLDNVLDVNHYPLPEIKDNCKNVRRIGLGVMGLHTMLISMGMRYASPEAHAFVDKLFSTLKNTAYDASTALAIEKGPFPKYDIRLLDSGFARTLKRGIRNKIRAHGLRNCALLTIAPTGTTSMVSGVSSGIEPMNPPVYWRTYMSKNTTGERELTRELVVEASYSLYPDTAESAADISIVGHFDMQRIVQAHIDNAVSKTINLPTNTTHEELSSVWLANLPFCKGTTVYRYGSRANEPISPVPRSEWETVINSVSKIEIDRTTADELLVMECPTGVCELPQYIVEKMK